MIIQKLYWYLRYGTTDKNKVKCKKEGHKWQIIGRTEVQVPEGQVDTFDDLPDEEFVVTEGPPLPDGQTSWAPIESSNEKCTRCDEYRHHQTP